MLKVDEKWYFTDNQYNECKAVVATIYNGDAKIIVYKKNNDIEYPWKMVGGMTIRAMLSHVAAKKLIYIKWLDRENKE